ncbi:MAG: glycosyltransferase family 4 protein [Saccharofermentanales bacterium]
MKILHINSYYSVSSFYRNLFERQRDGGLDIKVYCPVSDHIDTAGLALGEYTLLRKNHKKYDRVFFHVKHRKILADLMRTEDVHEYSIIHAHSLFSNGYIAYRLKRKFGIPYIVAVRNTDIHYFFKYMIHLRRLGIRILDEADGVIFLSESYRDLVASRYIPPLKRQAFLDKTQVIPNGIDRFWFEQAGTPKEPVDRDKLRLLYIGDINRNKNPLTTVAAIPFLAAKGIRAEFKVVGNIRDNNVYRALSAYSFVEILKPMPHSALIHLLRESDIFVMPSLKETFGLVYAEAMSQGLPVIYSRGQGFDRQFPDGGAGFPVDALNAGEISDRIVQIADSYAEMSARCIQLSHRFDWDRIEQLYKDLYQKIALRYQVPDNGRNR